MRVKCEELALGSQEGNGIGFQSGRGCQGLCISSGRAVWAKTNRWCLAWRWMHRMLGVQPSLRDLCHAERASPTLKRWAIVGGSLRDKDMPDMILGQLPSPPVCAAATGLRESPCCRVWAMDAGIMICLRTYLFTQGGWRSFLLPEGATTIAQRFNVGNRCPRSVSPEGTADLHSHKYRSS
jgi:hypothetical protein